MRRSFLPLIGCLAACAGQPGMVTNVTPVQQLPLPAELTLVVPAEPNDILGLVYDGARASLGDTRSVGALDQKLRDNPCAEFLTREDGPEELKVADAWPIADPLVTLLDFDLYRPSSTHLFVMVDAASVARAEPGEGYDACCAEQDCGDGMVSAVHSGRLNVHPAMAVRTAAPPLVLIARDGDSLALGLHDGRTFEGVVAVELTR